ncbi:MAG: PaaI family thioesterase, partial [Calditrichota bacterium]
MKEASDFIQHKIHNSFQKQGLMHTLGAEIFSVKEGEVIIKCPFRDGLSQQHGYFHAGVMSSLADTACGYAALTVMPEEAEVLSVEFKINMLRPAKTEEILAIGTVFKAGRTLVICDGLITDAVQETVFAKMQATM